MFIFVCLFLSFSGIFTDAICTEKRMPFYLTACFKTVIQVSAHQKMTTPQKNIKPVHNDKVVTPEKLDLRNFSPFQLQQTCALNFYFSTQK